ncbi:MOSC domain-containing protein [Hyaloraphidium curvatum]|nr:MOSC domain-containing protein [Hyaloraphidium curvatum]
MHLARISVHPIKSLPALSLPSSPVLPSGALAWDRRLALVDAKGRFVNGKREPRVISSRARFAGGLDRVVLRSEDGEEVSYALSDLDGIAGHFSRALGYPVRVEEDADRGFPDDEESPGPTVVSTASLEAVGSWFGLSLDEARARFRANLEVDGVPAFFEDRLAGPREGAPGSFRIGPVAFEGTGICVRCGVPARDPATGEMIAGFQRRSRTGTSGSGC